MSRGEKQTVSERLSAALASFLAHAVAHDRTPGFLQGLEGSKQMLPVRLQLLCRSMCALGRTINHFKTSQAISRPLFLQR